MSSFTLLYTVGGLLLTFASLTSQTSPAYEFAMQKCGDFEFYNLTPNPCDWKLKNKNEKIDASSASFL